jgi:hypothetical protein
VSRERPVEIGCCDDLAACYHAHWVLYTSLLKDIADGATCVGKDSAAVYFNNASFSHVFFLLVDDKDGFRVISVKSALWHT